MKSATRSMVDAQSCDLILSDLATRCSCYMQFWGWRRKIFEYIKPFSCSCDWTDESLHWNSQKLFIRLQTGAAGWAFLAASSTRHPGFWTVVVVVTRSRRFSQSMPLLRSRREACETYHIPLKTAVVTGFYSFPFFFFLRLVTTIFLAEHDHCSLLLSLPVAHTQNVWHNEAHGRLLSSSCAQT